MKTDTSEKGLESLIVTAMAGEPVRTPAAHAAGEATALYGGTGWRLGDWRDYDREYCVDLAQLPHLSNRDAAQGGRGARPRPGWPHAAQVPGPPAR